MDGSGRIRFTEFIAATIEAHGEISEERLAEAFDRLDSDDSGYISSNNLIELLGDEIPREQINEIISEADVTKDNKISYGEFLLLWEQKHEVEKEEQLNLLDDKVHQSMKCATSDVSDQTTTGRQDDGNAAVAHAKFLHEKYNHFHKDHTTR